MNNYQQLIRGTKVFHRLKGWIPVEDLKLNDSILSINLKNMASYSAVKKIGVETFTNKRVIDFENDISRQLVVENGYLNNNGLLFRTSKDCKDFILKHGIQLQNTFKTYNPISNKVNDFITDNILSEYEKLLIAYYIHGESVYTDKQGFQEVIFKTVRYDDFMDNIKLSYLKYILSSISSIVNIETYTENYGYYVTAKISYLYKMKNELLDFINLEKLTVHKAIAIFREILSWYYPKLNYNTNIEYFLELKEVKKCYEVSSILVIAGIPHVIKQDDRGVLGIYIINNLESLKDKSIKKVTEDKILENYYTIQLKDNFILTSWHGKMSVRFIDKYKK